MARVLTQPEAKSMGLPGRKSREVVSSEKGSQAVTLRLVLLCFFPVTDITKRAQETRSSEQ